MHGMGTRVARTGRLESEVRAYEEPSSTSDPGLIGAWRLGQQSGLCRFLVQEECWSASACAVQNLRHSPAPLRLNWQYKCSVSHFPGPGSRVSSRLGSREPDLIVTFYSLQENRS